jgi:hypothetical protein
MAKEKPLPVAPHEYAQGNEQTMRRTVEQELRALRLAGEVTASQKGAVESLALRRFQFLLMGA